MDLRNVTNEGLSLYLHLNDWYFKSGMYLSTSSRKQFDDLKENMRNFFELECNTSDLDRSSGIVSMTNAN